MVHTVLQVDSALPAYCELPDTFTVPCAKPPGIREIHHIHSAIREGIALRRLMNLVDELTDEELEEAAAMADAHQMELLARYDSVDDLAAAGLLAEAAAIQRQINLAQARQLVHAAHWADLHGVVQNPSGIPGSERLIQRGGDGTPQFAEFASAELGAVLGISVASAGLLIADALGLRHRLPLLWDAVKAGGVKIWVARKIAQRTRHLSQTAAGVVDRRIAPVAGTLPFGRLDKVLAAAVLAADPPQADDDTAQVEKQRGVWAGRDVDHGIGTVFGRADAPDFAPSTTPSTTSPTTSPSSATPTSKTSAARKPSA